VALWHWQRVPLAASASAEAVSDVMARILREKTPAERLAIANGMWRSARDMLRNLRRAENLDWSDEVESGFGEDKSRCRCVTASPLQADSLQRHHRNS
jgi:hypothetical protein